MAELTARWHQSLREIPEDHWQTLVGRDAIPFFRWGWLSALEESGSIAQRQGWHPLHLALWRGDCPIAIAPLYLKNHSYGEFIFDQAFAQLATDLGLNYYPKLIGMSPLSPIEGYRFFISPKEEEFTITKLIMEIIDSFAQKNNILSCNFLYVDHKWRPIAESTGCATWLNRQSLWYPNGANNFSDYLARFNANQRRNIKRERKAVQAAGLKISEISGPEINIPILHLMHNFYEQHCARWGIWGSKYLSKAFFESLAELPQRDQVLLFSAHRANPMDPVAMSLCITDGKTLWGRYWGSKENIDCLHFELCYYTPICWALNKGIHSFDPGAGGSHKQRRGFLAKSNASVHRWYNPQMNALIRTWLPKANELMNQEIKSINENMPLKVESKPLNL